MPGRGVSFLAGYVGRKDVGGAGRGVGLGRRASRSSITSSGSSSVNLMEGSASVLLQERVGGREGEGVRGRNASDLVSPPLCRQSVPRAEPLCCKKLANYPLSQVTVVRAGVVTLCAEGLLKLWARPTVPPSLPPLGAENLNGQLPSSAPKEKVRKKPCCAEGT